MSGDYRDDQRRKDWWNEKVWFMGGLTRNDLMWMAVGFIIGLVAFRFPVN